MTIKNCGSCKNWMIKSLCKREREGIFCTMSSPPCSDYERDLIWNPLTEEEKKVNDSLP
jgi:hypothetical protein